MSKLLLAGLVGILLSVAPARAQSPSGYSTRTEIQQRAHAARMAEIRRHNYAQQEAIRLLFGPQGLPALPTRGMPGGCGFVAIELSRIRSTIANANTHQSA